MKAAREFDVATRQLWHGVEFFGMPGSGKTTLAKELYSRLARDRSVVFGAAMVEDDGGLSRRLLAKSRLIATELLAGRVDGKTIASAFRTDQPSFRDRVRSASTVATVLSLDARLRRQGVAAILDQGILQSIWTIRLLSRSRGVGTLVDDLMDAAVASRRSQVVVETPTMVCEARLHGRASKHSRLQSATSSSSEVWYRAEELRREVLEDFRSSCVKHNVSPPMIVVDGTLNPDASVAWIFGQLPIDAQEDARRSWSAGSAAR